MAGRLTLLKSTELSYGSVRRRVLYWYVISPRITDSTGVEIAPQNRNQIPQGDGSPLLYLSTTDLTALDAGDAGYEILEQVQTGGETLAAFRNRLLADHTSRQSAWIASRRSEYAAAGTSVA